MNNFILSLCLFWPMLAAVAAVPYLVGESGAEVVFDTDGPVLAVSRCAHLNAFNVRTFDRFLLVDMLDCGEDTQHIVIESGRKVAFFTQHEALGLRNMQVVIEEGAEATFLAPEVVLFERAPEIAPMFTVEGSLRVYAGRFGVDYTDFEGTRSSIVETIGDGTFSHFNGSIIKHYDAAMSIAWPNVMDTDDALVPYVNTRMATTEEMMDYDWTGEPSTGSIEEVDRLIENLLSTLDAVHTNKSTRCDRYHFWCRSKALVRYVFAKLKHFAFGNNNNNNNNTTDDASDKAQKKGRARRFWGAAKRFGRGAKNVLGLVKEHLDSRTPEDLADCTE